MESRAQRGKCFGLKRELPPSLLSAERPPGAVSVPAGVGPGQLAFPGSGAGGEAASSGQLCL